MQVTIFHNTTKDAFGRHVGMVDGYQPGHIMVEVASYTTDVSDPYRAAEEAFHLFNVGDDPQYGTPSPIAVAYRARGLRSLSVGDVVVAGDNHLACAPMGWETVPADETDMAV